MSKKVLLVSGFLPSDRVPSGGQQLVYAAARKLAETASVTLLAFCNEHEHAHLREVDFSFCQKAQIFELNRSKRILACARYPLLPLIASSRFDVAKSWLTAELAENRYDHAHFEFIQVGALCELAATRVPTTLVVHDLFHEAIERRARAARGWRAKFLHWEAKRTLRWESLMLKRPQELMTLTQKDSDKIRHLSGRSSVTLRYPSRPVSGLYPRTRESIIPNTILFFGQMSRDENVDGALWFIETILPRIKIAIPEVRLIIAGANPRREILSHAGPAVEVPGFIETPELLFSRSHLAIAPLRLGAGVKIKVIEYLAAGLPTVATSVGAEGVVPSPLLSVADSEAEFAQTCIRILSQQL